MTDLTHFRTPLRPTPFHPRTSAANLLHRWGNWSGWLSALCFGDVAMEHAAIRNAATLYDLCPMVKYRITGPDAAAYLGRLTLRDAARLPVGAVHYTAWTDDAGRLLDDGTLFRHAEADYLLCCQERHLPWLLASAEGYDVAVADITEEIAALAVQGPCAASVLRAAGFDIAALRPFRMARMPFAGDTITISRTGFTGDLGYEIWLRPDQALPLWDHLVAAGAPWGIRPIGTEALDLARIEAGFIVANQDFIPAHQALREDRPRSPLEMGLGWMIDWDKGHFTGRRALLEERARGPRWTLVGLDIPGNTSAAGAILYHNRRKEAGHVTAAAWSPMLKASIALAQVHARHAEGRDLWVEIYAQRELQYARLMLPVQVVARPFLDLPRRRATPPGDV